MKKGEQLQIKLEQEVKEWKERHAEVEREHSALNDDLEVLLTSKARLDEAFNLLYFFISLKMYSNIRVINRAGILLEKS